MLKIQFKDRRKPAMWLVDSVLKIGSDSSCDIVVSEPNVVAFHAELIISQEQILLKNISQGRSIFVNDVPVVSEQTLNAWDVIKFGESELEIIDPLQQRSQPLNAEKAEGATVIRQVVSPWMLKAQTIPLEGQYFSLSDGMFVGREDDCDIKIPLSYVSRKHARLSIKKEQLFVDDMGSSNGTYVNGERTKSRQLFNGDELRFDEFIFHVIGPEDDAKKKTTNNKAAITKEETNKNSDKDLEAVQALIKKGIYLHGISDDVKGQVFTINQEESHLSSMLGHHLSRSEISVSARHVYLYATADGWKVKNNGASDGLRVNERMTSEAILNEGDTVTIGNTLLTVHSQAKLSDSYEPEAKKSNAVGKLAIITIVIITAILFALYFPK
jgi:pSer/pThr/pTyr-binding forkhead associated (FHA) protein